MYPCRPCPPCWCRLLRHPGVGRGPPCHPGWCRLSRHPGAWRESLKAFPCGARKLLKAFPCIAPVRSTNPATAADFCTDRTDCALNFYQALASSRVSGRCISHGCPARDPLLGAQARYRIHIPCCVRQHIKELLRYYADFQELIFKLPYVFRTYHIC